MYNRVILMGRLVKDPEVRHTGNDTTVANFTLAVNREYVNANRGVVDVDYFRCSAWRQTADFVGKYFTKGMLVLVDGKLHSREWRGRDGQERREWTVDVQTVSFAGSYPRRGDADAAAAAHDDKDNDPFKSSFDDIGNPPAFKQQADGLPTVTSFDDLMEGPDDKVPF